MCRNSIEAALGQLQPYTSAAAMIKIARTYSTAVVQRLHTALVASSNLAMSTTKNSDLLLESKVCIINVLVERVKKSPTDF